MLKIHLLIAFFFLSRCWPPATYIFKILYNYDGTKIKKNSLKANIVAITCKKKNFEFNSLLILFFLFNKIVLTILIPRVQQKISSQLQTDTNGIKTQILSKVRSKVEEIQQQKKQHVYRVGGELGVIIHHSFILGEITEVYSATPLPQTTV